MEAEDRRRIGQARQMAEESCTLQNDLHIRVSHLGSSSEMERIAHLMSVQNRQLEALRLQLAELDEG